ncbi:Retrovirus-related Pol polyprotein from transposon 17.6, partial [Mucuna pruriens]
MVIKSKATDDHYGSLGRLFEILRKYRLRLNPAKCSFGVQAGKFLGYMLTERGIEANSEKCEGIIRMRSPQSVREVQQLVGRITALSRFISRLTETAVPIFNTLKKGGNFTWTPECEEAFLRFKAMLASPLILTRPIPEKAALALVVASRRLRPYFQGHDIVVRTDLLICQVLQKPDLARRMVAWSVQLSEFSISFEKRGPVKAQVLADFITELTPVEASPTIGGTGIYRLTGPLTTPGVEPG